MIIFVQVFDVYHDYCKSIRNISAVETRHNVVVRGVSELRRNTQKCIIIMIQL